MPASVPPARPPPGFQSADNYSFAQQDYLGDPGKPGGGGKQAHQEVEILGLSLTQGPHLKRQAAVARARMCVCVRVCVAMSGIQGCVYSKSSRPLRPILFSTAGCRVGLSWPHALTNGPSLVLLSQPQGSRQQVTDVLWKTASSLGIRVPSFCAAKENNQGVCRDSIGSFCHHPGRCLSFSLYPAG